MTHTHTHRQALLVALHSVTNLCRCGRGRLVACKVHGEYAVAGHDRPHLLGLDSGGQRVLPIAFALRRARLTAAATRRLILDTLGTDALHVIGRWARSRACPR